MKYICILLIILLSSCSSFFVNETKQNKSWIVNPEVKSEFHILTTIGVINENKKVKYYGGLFDKEIRELNLVKNDTIKKYIKIK